MKKLTVILIALLMLAVATDQARGAAVGDQYTMDIDAMTDNGLPYQTSFLLEIGFAIPPWGGLPYEALLILDQVPAPGAAGGFFDDWNGRVMWMYGPGDYEAGEYPDVIPNMTYRFAVSVKNEEGTALQNYTEWPEGDLLIYRFVDAWRATDNSSQDQVQLISTEHLVPAGAIPEPASLLMFGLVGIGITVKRKMRN